MFFVSLAYTSINAVDTLAWYLYADSGSGTYLIQYMQFDNCELWDSITTRWLIVICAVFIEINDTREPD